MSTAIFYDLENISKFTAPKNYNEFKSSLQKIGNSELVDDIILQRAYISTTHPAYIKYHKFLNSTGIDICGVDPHTNSGKANLVDFKMNVDCIAYSLSNSIDTVVIATGDADFGFLCEELKSCGKRVVVASYGITTNKSIIMLSDDWVDFSGEYRLVDIAELFKTRIRLPKSDDYRMAVRMVLGAMLNDKLIKRYMSLGRFTLDTLREFTESICPAPTFNSMEYADFVALLIDGINISISASGDDIIITPSNTALEAPPLNLYEAVSGLDFDFSSKRFKAWHEWFEENIESLPELMYYLEFMTRNNLIRINNGEAEIISKRKCATALVDHTANAVSLLNVAPDKEELEKLKQRFYKEPTKRTADVIIEEEPVTEVIEEVKNTYVQGVMTNFGRVVIFADDEAVTRIDFTEEFVKYKINSVTLRAVQEIREYFKGERSEFSVPVKFEGSEFQKSVWNALREIPYGETRTYSDIAKAIGKPKSSRAVGSACNKNKLPFIIPCHRVVAASGNDNGFALGLELKKALLASEVSPIDFRRFGKIYSHNAANPEATNEYVTSAEISRIDAERKESENIDIVKALPEVEANTEAEPKIAEIPVETSAEEQPKPKKRRTKKATPAKDSKIEKTPVETPVGEQPKKHMTKKAEPIEEPKVDEAPVEVTTEVQPQPNKRRTKKAKTVEITKVEEVPVETIIEEQPKPKKRRTKRAKSVEEPKVDEAPVEVTVEEQPKSKKRKSKKAKSVEEPKVDEVTVDVTAEEQPKSEQKPKPVRKPYRRRTQRKGSIAKKMSAKKTESKES